MTWLQAILDKCAAELERRKGQPMWLKIGLGKD
jgi:hypothetical protein